MTQAKVQAMNQICFLLKHWDSQFASDEKGSILLGRLHGDYILLLVRPDALSQPRKSITFTSSLLTISAAFFNIVSPGDQVLTLAQAFEGVVTFSPHAVTSFQ